MTSTWRAGLVTVGLLLGPACEDETDTLDAGLSGCSEPQPTCRRGGDPSSIYCCVQTDPCGVCFGDGVTASACVQGAWTCGPQLRLESQCRGFAWQGDASGAPPPCDAGI